MTTSDAARTGPPPDRHAAHPRTADQATRPPMWLLGLSAAAIVLSASLLWLSGRTVDLVGYLLATMVTVLLIAAFRSIDDRRRTRPAYVLPVLAQRLPPRVTSWLLLGVGVLVGGAHVWRFAEAVARQ